MYIKRVVKKNKGSRKKYIYLHLVETIRTAHGPRQKLILNLGTLPIKKERYKELANCIESMLTGQSELISHNKTITNYASEAVKKITRKKSSLNSLQEPVLRKDIRLIDVTSLESSEIRTLGSEYICYKMWHLLELNSCLLNSGVSSNILPLLQALVIGRAVSPGSERHTKSWADTRSAIYELSGKPLRDSLNSYYRGGDILYQCKDSLERHLSIKEHDLFSLNEQICFFDLSNTHFEGEMKKNGKAKFGRSKQKRNNCRLLTLALIIDEDGFIKHSKLYAGNQYEAYTLETMLEELEKINPFHSDTGKPTIVMDAGIADQDNIAYLKQQEFHYIVVNRGNSPFMNSDLDTMTPLKVDQNGEISISVKRFDDDANNEVYILCKSKRREIKEKGIATRQQELFLEQLKNIKEGLPQKGRVKKYSKIVERVGRLREKYPKASKRYEVDILVEDIHGKDITKLQASDITWQKKEKISADAQSINGCYVLRTDRIDLNTDEIWNTYVMLTNIEHAFRDMKSFLGLRPNFHQLEKRGDTHMFISVLAYHLTHMIEYKLKKKGYTHSWQTIREIMSTHSRLTVECTEYEGSDKVKGKVFVRICSKPESSHNVIYQKLNLSSIPLEKKYYENL